MENFEFAISLILMLVVTVDVAVAYLLARGAVKSNYSILALNERAFVALSQATSGIMLGVLGANRIFSLNLPNEVVLVVLSLALIIQATPGFVWLTLYLTHKFGGGNGTNPVDESKG